MLRRRSRRTSAAGLVTALLVGVALAACGGSGSGGATQASSTASGGLLAAVRDKQVLRVANTQANPPWNFVDKSQGVSGYDVDVAREIARRMGVEKVEFLPGTFENFIPGVEAGRFDLVVSGQTITPEREKAVGFSRPYQVNGVGIFVARSNATIRGKQDLDGKTIAVSAGTTQEEQARQQFPDADVKTYSNATLALTDVANGRADASMVSRFQGSYVADKNHLAVKPVGAILQAEVNGMSFEKGQPAFKAAIDKALSGMVDDGTLARISKRWLGLDMAAELAKLKQPSS